MSWYDFCTLKHGTNKVFDMQNIISSFKATGICRGAVHLSSDNEFSFKPNNLAEKTGLAYIVLPVVLRLLRLMII